MIRRLAWIGPVVLLVLAVMKSREDETHPFLKGEPARFERPGAQRPELKREPHEKVPPARDLPHAQPSPPAGR